MGTKTNHARVNCLKGGKTMTELLSSPSDWWRGRRKFGLDQSNSVLKRNKCIPRP